jgi:hypothetical protein
MSIGNNLNYIKNIWKHPCGQPNPSIMIEMALPAVTMAILSLTALGCTDIVKAKLGVSPWHTRGIKALIKGAADPKVIGPTKFLYASGYGLIEAALWWWMVADAVTGGVADYMSMVYQEQGCSEPGKGHIRCGVSSLYLGAGANHGVFLDTREEKECIAVGGNVITVPPGCIATITWNLNFGPFHGEPRNQGTVACWLLASDGKRHSEMDGFMDKKTGLQSVGGGTHISVKAFTDQMTFRLQWSNTGGTMGVQEGNLSISSYGRRMRNFTFGCHPRLLDQPYPVKPVDPPRKGESQDSWLHRIEKALVPENQ